MKERTIKNEVMKETLHIAADFDKPLLLKHMVEQLVSKPYHRGFRHPEKDMMETASTEAFVCGTISLDDNGTLIQMPFDSSFLFTCVKGIGGEFEITWGASLS